MSRSGYTDDCENLAVWRGAVRAATVGKRGQKLLTELLAALDAMPEKELIAHELEADGAHCALGVVGAARGVAMAGLDPEDSAQVSAAFDIAGPLAKEIVYENDEGGYWNETPAERWARVRAWVARQLEPTPWRVNKNPHGDGFCIARMNRGNRELYSTPAAGVAEYPTRKDALPDVALLRRAA